MKIKKRKKSSRMHGKGMGSHGWGARKKHKKSGSQGGKGMAGSGKRADQRKTQLLNLYGNNYFGKQGITSRGTERDKRDRINLMSIDNNVDSYVRKGVAKKTNAGFEIDFKTYKILDSSKDYKVKNKLIIKAKEASKSAIEKVKKAGGDILLPPKKEIKEKSVVEKPVGKNEAAKVKKK